MKRVLVAGVASVLMVLPAAAQTLEPTAPPEPPGMKPLCNGRDLAGWEGDPRLWSVKDGAIRGETTLENPTYGNTFLLYVGDQGKPVVFKDFELRLSCRIETGNAGVQYRSTHKPFKDTDRNKWVVAGYQAEVANAPGTAGFLYHESGRGGLVNVGDKVEIGEDGKPRVVGKLGDRQAIASTYRRSGWNDYVIRCEGNHVRHWLNGIQVIELIDNDTEPAVGPNGRPRPYSNRCMEGILALQIHAGPPMWVEYKNTRIKELHP
ncbi:MAG: DUF1080 domain-containing protein [Verrucomicrobia bacterium]|nr:DUF1080 domain-containing protein [Verrucomicrobiota bacterium]